MPLAWVYSHRTVPPNIQHWSGCIFQTDDHYPNFVNISPALLSFIKIQKIMFLCLVVNTNVWWLDWLGSLQGTSPQCYWCIYNSVYWKYQCISFSSWSKNFTWPRTSPVTMKLSPEQHKSHKIIHMVRAKANYLFKLNSIETILSVKYNTSVINVIKINPPMAILIKWTTNKKYFLCVVSCCNLLPWRQANGAETMKPQEEKLLVMLAGLTR